MVFVAVACGLAGAFSAVVFRLMIRFVQAVFFHGTEGISALMAEGLLADPGDPLHLARDLSWQWRLAIPTLGGQICHPDCKKPHAIRLVA